MKVNVKYEQSLEQAIFWFGLEKVVCIYKWVTPFEASIFWRGSI